MIRLPNSIKNPRKLKKAQKKAILSRLREFGRNGVDVNRYKLRWVPRNGWTVTVLKSKVPQ